MDARRVRGFRRRDDVCQAVGASPRGGIVAAVKLPASHVMIRSGAVRAAIRRDLVATLGPWLLAPRLVLPGGAEPLATGRGAAFRVALADGTRVLLRPSRPGALVAR